jgi:DNA-binding transcriptional MerR regulator
MATAYKIGEAAALLNLKTYVLRFWETEFPHIVPLRTEKGQRLYTEENLALLERIRFLLHERGLTIEGARKVLNEDREKGVSYVFTAGAELHTAPADEAPQAAGPGPEKEDEADEEPDGPEEEAAQGADAADNDPDAGDSVVEKFLAQYNLPGINKSYPIHERSLFERKEHPDKNEPPAVRRRELLSDELSRLTTDNGAAESVRPQGAARALLRSLAVELEAIVLLLRHG